VLLNKADVATEAELQQARAVAQALNESAEVLVTDHGRVAPEVVLPPSMFSPRADVARSDHRALCGGEGVEGRSEDSGVAHVQEPGHGHGHGHGHEGCGDPHCTDPSHDHRSSAERRFGIRSFVYMSRRPFSKLRFVAELQRWQEAWQKMGKTLELKGEAAPAPGGADGSADQALPAGDAGGRYPLSPVLRSKGLLWMDSQPRDALYWSHAGRSASLSHWGFWPHFPSAPGPAGVADPGSQAAEAARAAYSEWAQSALGRARSELVFIGAGIDESAVRARLDACLLTDEELAALPASSRPAPSS